MANLNERMVALGTSRSVIRELFEFGKKRAAEIGAENVFDFSIGNPSVPSPDAVNETAIKLLLETDPVIIHGYTSAQGDIEVRKLLADSVNRRFGTSVGPDNFYVSVGAAAALCCCLNGLCNREDEVIVFAPYFPEYKVFIEGAGAKMSLIPADTKAFQIDFEKFEAAINKKTKAVIVNSPNNPCGVVYSHETCTKLAQILRTKSAELGHPIYLIADEPYSTVSRFHTCRNTTTIPWSAIPGPNPSPFRANVWDTYLFRMKWRNMHWYMQPLQALAAPLAM